jgi:hypothetical protein
MFSVNDAKDIPTEGKSRVIVADWKYVWHFRIFDSAGHKVVDTEEGQLLISAGRMKDFRDRLAKLQPPHELSPSEKQQVITAVTSMVGYTPGPPGPQAYSRYYDQQSKYVRENHNVATCVLVGLLIGALTLPAPWLLLRWRKRQQLRSAVALQQKRVQQIARDYPDWVQHWGGGQLLNNPAVVKEILAGLERAVPG